MKKCLFFAAILLAYALHYFHLSPLYESLVPISWLNKIGLMLFILLSFAGVLFGFYGMGHLILRLLRSPHEDSLFTLALGMVGTGFLTMGLGGMHLLYTPLLLLLHFAFTAYALYTLRAEAGVIQGLTSRCKVLLQGQPLMAGLVALTGTSLWLVTMIPHNHGDPLYYHLPQGWLWLQAGQTYFIEWMPWFMQGGMAEYVYTWIGALTHERFTMMLLSQMLHGVVGIGVGGAAVYQLTARFTGRAWALMAVLSYWTFSEELYMLVRAKNDGFVAAFCLLTARQAMAYWDHKKAVDLWRVYALGFFALACKLTALFFLLPFLGLFLVVDVFTENRRVSILINHLRLAVAPSLMALAVPLRNFVYTGNPFFPTYHHLFPNPFMNDFLAQEIAKFGYVPGRLQEILLSQGRRILWAKYIFPIFPLAWLDGRRVPRFLVALIIVSLILICIITGQGLYGRFTFFMYGLLSVTALVACGALERRWLAHSFQTWKVKGMHILVVGTILANAQVEVLVGQAWKKTMNFVFSSQAYGGFLAEHKENYEVHRWMNEHLQDAYIFSLGENEVFFLNHPLSVPLNHRGASEVYLATNYEEAVTTLKKYRFTHVYFGEHGYFPKSYLPILTGDARFADDFEEIYQKNGYHLFRIR